MKNNHKLSWHRVFEKPHARTRMEKKTQTCHSSWHNFVEKLHAAPKLKTKDVIENNLICGYSITWSDCILYNSFKHPLNSICFRITSMQILYIAIHGCFNFFMCYIRFWPSRYNHCLQKCVSYIPNIRLCTSMFHRCKQI